MQVTAEHHRTGRTLIRLLLAAVLAVSPLLGYAGGTPLSDDDGGDRGSAAAHQTPCHTAAGHAADPAPPACPHCTADDLASQCQCCGHAAPAGIASLGDNPAAVTAAGVPPGMDLADPLPESAADRLYRPPIFPG